MKQMKDNKLLSRFEYCFFTEFYQAYRLLLFTLYYDGSFLFIHDERNPAFLTTENGVERGKYKRFKQLLPKNIAGRVYILSIQKIVQYLNQTQKHSWLSEFEVKYM